MGLGLKRSDLQALAQAKLDDALILIGNSRYSNGYYLAGYAIEMGLKACIAKQFSAEMIPEKSFVLNIYTHDFRNLVGLAGLTSDLKPMQDANPNFAANWALVAQWIPDSRYEVVDAMAAQTFMSSITDQNIGVFPWIKTHW